MAAELPARPADDASALVEKHLVVASRMLACAPCLLLALAVSPPRSLPAGEPGLPVPLVAAVAQQPGGEGRPGPVDLPLRRDGETTVAVNASFRVEAAAALRDARLVLYDAQDALVPAVESAEIGSVASRFQVHPSGRLQPGSHYLLRLEGAASRELRDLSGSAYRALEFRLATAGEPPRSERPTRRKGARPTHR